MHTKMNFLQSIDDIAELFYKRNAVLAISMCGGATHSSSEQTEESTTSTGMTQSLHQLYFDFFYPPPRDFFSPDALLALVNVGAVLVAYQPRVPNDKIEIHVVAAPILLESIPGQGYDTLVDLTQLSSLTRTTHLKSSHKYYYSTYSFFTFDSNRPVNQILYYYSFPCSTFSLLLMVFS